jgi:hypothetical protein
MIDEKLDIKNIINAINELEKLKLLLFDETQYCLFEHIPKPIICDQELIDEELHSKGLENIVALNAQFWEKRSLKEKKENFKAALNTIKTRDEDGRNIIDRRLIEIMDQMGIHD